MDLFDNAVEVGTATQEDFGLIPYVLPTMEEVAALSGTNGLKAVGSFSGCGGSSLGLRMAGFDVPYAIEFIPIAAETYRANSPGTFVDERDIRKIMPENILSRLGLKAGELDVFEGSPPCASFSAAGTGTKTREQDCPTCNGDGRIGAHIDDDGREVKERECLSCAGTGRTGGTVKKYSETKQRTDDLFEQWIRLLEGLQPRAFIAENVPGMASGSALDGYARVVGRTLARLGYHVRADVLNSSWYGVPQARKRILFVGIRKDVEQVVPLEQAWPPPVETPRPHTVRQALELVDPDDPDHAPFVASSSMDGYAVGRTWDALVHRGAVRESHGNRNAIPPLEDFCARCGALLNEHDVGRRDNKGRVVDAKCKLGEHAGEDAIITKDYFMLQVPKLDEPSPTLTATGAQAGAASVTHPTERRKFTPAEAKAVCSFPQDFILTGTREQRYERMGRAVPPLMMRAVGRAVARVLGVPGGTL